MHLQRALEPAKRGWLYVAENIPLAGLSFEWAVNGMRPQLEATSDNFQKLYLYDWRS